MAEPAPTSQAPPCGWEPITACCPGWEAIDEEIQTTSLEVATDIIWRLSGMQFGLCDVLLRPCGRPCMGSSYADAYSAYGGMWMRPSVIGGSWFNISCGCPSDCDCDGVHGVVLPAPAVSVTEVLMDGEILEADSYALVNGVLVRSGGSQWPICQDMTLPTTEPDTWQVTYVQGRPVPAGGNLAAGALACELAKACTGGKCRLPDRITDITREGVSMTFLDPQDFLTNGRTGIREIDQWLAAVNPFTQRSPAKVWSPDLPTHWRV